MNKDTRCITRAIEIQKELKLFPEDSEQYAQLLLEFDNIVEELWND